MLEQSGKSLTLNLLFLLEELVADYARQDWLMSECFDRFLDLLLDLLVSILSASFQFKATDE